MELVKEREVSIFEAFFGAIKRMFITTREESNIKNVKCKMCCKTCEHKRYVNNSGELISMRCVKRQMLVVESDMVCPRYELDTEMEA